MPKHDALNPKAIANRQKSIGLQKLRWYCQMCQKQCRDENGFKCHTMSEGHLRQMRVFAENPNNLLDEFSAEFLKGFVSTLHHRHGTKRIQANRVYQEYIGDKNHVHMNATRWVTLTQLCMHIGKEGIAVVDETEKGWFIQYIDRDPKLLAKRAEAEANKQFELDEEEKRKRDIDAQIAAAAADSSTTGISSLEMSAEEREEAYKLQVSADGDNAVIGSIGLSLVPSHSRALGGSEAGGALLKKKRPLASAFAADDDDDEDDTDNGHHGGNEGSAAISSNNSAPPSKRPSFMPPSSLTTSKSSSLPSNTESSVKTGNHSSSSSSTHTTAEAKYTDNDQYSKTSSKLKASNPSESTNKKESSSDSYESLRALATQQSRKSHWLRKGLVVKIVGTRYKQDSSADSLYKQKVVVQRVHDRYIGEVTCPTEEGSKDRGRGTIKIDQQDLDTVIPKVGQSLMIVNGLGRGCRATLLRVHIDRFCCDVQLDEDVYFIHNTGNNNRDKSEKEVRVTKRGEELCGLEYEDVCKVSEDY